MIPNPMTLIKGKGELPEVEQMGTMTVEQLNQYHCNNPDRRMLCMFGTIFDVTTGVRAYGPDGAYKEYAGHDITLALSKSKTDETWLDKFVVNIVPGHPKANEKWVKDGTGWKEYMGAKYPECGKLDKWENTEDWPEMTEEELEAFEKGCVIM